MGTRLFVGNLSYAVNEQELKEAFVSEGVEVRSVRISLDRETGRPRGFAFVETMTDDGCKLSIEKLSGRILQGRPMIVEEAQAKPAGGARPPGPGVPPSGPGGPARGFGPRPTGAFGAAGAPNAGGPGFGPPRTFGPRPEPGTARSFSGPRPGGAPFPPRPDDKPARADAPRRERPEKKRSTRPKAEDRERGNWRWNGRIDED